jgi:ribosomal protein S2
MKIYEADVADYTIPKNQKTIKAINFLYGILAQRAASQLTPTPQEQ